VPTVLYHLPGAAKDLIRQLLHPNPSKRITPAAALEHPWLARSPSAATAAAPAAAGAGAGAAAASGASGAKRSGSRAKGRVSSS
jgi:hypothetical protein